MTAHPCGPQGLRVVVYEIVVRGRLSPRYERAFEGVTLAPGEGTTVLRCEVRDQSQLYGLLDQLRDLGIELVSVNRLPGAGDGS